MSPPIEPALCASNFAPFHGGQPSLALVWELRVFYSRCDTPKVAPLGDKLC
jgi:hypothetical protein